MPFRPNPKTNRIERDLIRPESAVVAAFREAGIPLNLNLERQLNNEPFFENNKHGAGFTSASVYLSRILNGQYPKTWLFNFDYPAFISGDSDEEVLSKIDSTKIREILKDLTHEEDILIVRFILDLVELYEIKEGELELPFNDEPIVGNCSSAELYFLEFITDDASYLIRGDKEACINVITDDKGRPIMLEKQGLGDSFSCLTLEEVVLNGVGVPAGSLLATQYDPQKIHTQLAYDKTRESSIIPVSECEGFKILRLSTLAVSPKNRKRTFSNHLSVQEKFEFPGYNTVTLDDFRQRASRMVGL